MVGFRPNIPIFRRLVPNSFTPFGVTIMKSARRGRDITRGLQSPLNALSSQALELKENTAGVRRTRYRYKICSQRGEKLS